LSYFIDEKQKAPEKPRVLPKVTGKGKRRAEGQLR
jgi:hypothetical protein